MKGKIIVVAIAAPIREYEGIKNRFKTKVKTKVINASIIEWIGLFDPAI